MDLIEVTLMGANLRDANLSGVTLMVANLSGAFYDKETRFDPGFFDPGFTPADHGMILVEDEEEHEQ